MQWAATSFVDDLGPYSSLEINVVDKKLGVPADGYKTVAEEAKKQLSEDIHPFMTRGQPAL